MGGGFILLLLLLLLANGSPFRTRSGLGRVGLGVGPVQLTVVVIVDKIRCGVRCLIF